MTEDDDSQDTTFSDGFDGPWREDWSGIPQRDEQKDRNFRKLFRRYKLKFCDPSTDEVQNLIKEVLKELDKKQEEIDILIKSDNNALYSFGLRMGHADLRIVEKERDSYKAIVSEHEQRLKEWIEDNYKDKNVIGYELSKIVMASFRQTKIKHGVK